VSGERPLVIVGAGENAAIAYEYFTHDSPHTVVAFGVKREFLDATELYGLPILALDELPKRFPPSDLLVLVAIPWTHLNRVRMRLYEAIEAAGYQCASYVTSNAFAWHNLKIGENTFVFKNNVLQHHVAVGDNVVLSSGNHVGHRTKIGCFVSSHVVISGNPAKPTGRDSFDSLGVPR